MPRKPKDLIGRKFGHLTVLKKLPKKAAYSTLWLCECDCPAKTLVEARQERLLKWITQSCGCSNIHSCLTHGLGTKGSKYHRLYSIYMGMLQRCFNPNSKGYKAYGGRGIIVCDEWQEWTGLINFVEWALSHGYTEDLEIDRIDPFGNYEPGNCKWSTDKEQGDKKRNTIKMPFNGREISIMEFLETVMTELTYNIIKDRYHRGWSWEKILATPVKKYRKAS